MTHTSPNEFMLKKVVGPRVAPIDLARLMERAAKFPKDQALSLWATVVQRAGRSEVAEAEALDSMGFCLALKELIAEHQLDAIAVGCYPRLMGRVCLAASLLADEGIPLACEGDVHGAVGQLMLSLLTGGPTHNTDWLEPLHDGSIVFTHCGSGSFSLAEKAADIRLASVRLTGQGVCALFPARPGPVTLVSLLALPAGYQCALLEGEALRTEMVFPGNPLRVRFGRTAQELIEWVAAEGIGHHWMAGYGHVGRELRAWADMAGDGLRLIEP
jgi:L-fucose isomerase-like protein